MKPSPGRIVLYVSRTGNYVLPAIVNCTTDSIYQPGVDAGFVPPLSSDEHVHLTVFSPGRPGMRITAGETPGSDEFLVKSPYPVSENVSGCYQEWDIPYDEGADGIMPVGDTGDTMVVHRHASPGSWHWPPRI